MVNLLTLTPDGGRESYLRYMEAMERLKVQYRTSHRVFQALRRPIGRQ
jgi:hypothetical protein